MSKSANAFFRRAVARSAALCERIKGRAPELLFGSKDERRALAMGHIRMYKRVRNDAVGNTRKCVSRVFCLSYGELSRRTEQESWLYCRKSTQREYWQSRWRSRGPPTSSLPQGLRRYFAFSGSSFAWYCDAHATRLVYYSIYRTGWKSVDDGLMWLGLLSLSLCRKRNRTPGQQCVLCNNACLLSTLRVQQWWIASLSVFVDCRPTYRQGVPSPSDHQLQQLEASLIQSDNL